MTKWERKEFSIQKGIATRNINRELKPYTEVGESGFSRAQMGSNEAKELMRTLESFKNIETASRETLKNIKTRLKIFGASDYDMKKAIIYKENYMTMLEKTYKNFKNYDKLEEKLNSYENPIAFWEFIKEYELLRDIEYMYEFNQHGIRGVSTQTRFNRMLEELGITIKGVKNK